MGTTQNALGEIDPKTVQKVKDGYYLVKAMSETEVAARKCEFYAGNCADQNVADFFYHEAKKLRQARKIFQDYFEGEMGVWL